MSVKEAESRIGKHLREIRARKGLTLRDLVARTDLAASTLSKIENGRLPLTFDKLVILARALEVDVSSLLSANQDSAPTGRRSITRATQGAMLETDQYTYEILCGDLARKRIVPLLTRVHTKNMEEFGELVRHEGEEFFYVIKGEIELHTEFYEPTILRPGDSAYFDSTMGHALTCSKGDGLVLWVSTELSRPDLGTDGGSTRNVPSGPVAGGLRSVDLREPERQRQRRVAAAGSSSRKK